MRRFPLLLSLVVCAVSVLGFAPCARAMPTVLLGFGAEYRAPDGATRVHQGLDLAGEAGAQVGSLAAGEVVFAGKVPADEGGQVFAVTVRTADDVLVTLHPLASVVVARGETVASGQALGELAASGDGSSAGTHLHASARRSGVYIDPAFLLRTDAAQEPPPDPAPQLRPRTIDDAPAASAPAAAARGTVAAVRPSSVPALRSSGSVASGAARTSAAPEATTHAKPVRSSAAARSRAYATDAGMARDARGAHTTDSADACQNSLGGMLLALFGSVAAAGVAGARAPALGVAMALAAGMVVLRRRIAASAGEDAAR